jgi:hypothetical protein
MAKKKHEVADIDSLLGTIAEKRPELPKTEIQHVQPVSAAAEEPAPSSAVIPAKRENRKTGKDAAGTQDVVLIRAPGGRPTSKRPDVEYVKISPLIPKPLKKHADLALIEERFDGPDGKPVKTMDVLVELALTRLLQNT